MNFRLVTSRLKLNFPSVTKSDTKLFEMMKNVQLKVTPTNIRQFARR